MVICVQGFTRKTAKAEQDATQMTTTVTHVTHVELTLAMQDAIALLVSNQKKNVRTGEELAFDFLAQTILNRAVAMKNGAIEEQGKLYDLAIAAGFAPPMGRAEFVSSKLVLWDSLIANLEYDAEERKKLLDK